jgi:hypothetical protein
MGDGLEGVANAFPLDVGVKEDDGEPLACWLPFAELLANLDVGVCLAFGRTGVVRPSKLLSAGVPS